MRTEGETDLTKSVFLLNTIGKIFVGVVSREGSLGATLSVRSHDSFTQGRKTHQAAWKWQGMLLGKMSGGSLEARIGHSRTQIPGKCGETAHRGPLAALR